MHPSYRDLPGIHPSPNIQTSPDVYELENRAADPDQRIEQAMQAIATWDGKIVLDLGAGTGFHIPRFQQAAHVFAVEPHDDSRLLAMQRISDLGLRNVSILKGSAEYIPLRDQSVDICHSRFAYFFAPDCLPGLQELERVMGPGGTAFIIDNDLVEGTFAEWLQCTPYYKKATAAKVAHFWREQGFIEQSIPSEWRFARREDLEKVVRLEFGDDLAGTLLAQHEGLRITYHYKLYYRSY
ncbi:MAG TPA: class I SAM-dependent methyltransferase [Anaerolineales bacterium]|jgi:ubiquinone/menaquinone biosynthesis C-methylase UbiE|nr:class I SAM-dependent methyltransferase [Anaerolineales bacterium]